MSRINHSNRPHPRGRLHPPSTLGLAVVAGCAFTGVASAQPYVFMYTSSGTLLRGLLGTDDYTVIGQGNSDPSWFAPNTILSLETAKNGRLYANFTYHKKNTSTHFGGTVAEVNRSTGFSDYKYSLSDDPNFADPNTDLDFGGAMGVHDDGSFYMLNWNFGAIGPIFLHQFDVATGQVISKVETQLANKLSGALTFRNDGMLLNIDYGDSRMTVLDPTTGQTISETVIAGISNITGLTTYNDELYLATQYGDIYSFNADTLDYALVSRFGTDHGTTWGMTVNPTPGTLFPVLAGLGFIARRRRD